MTPTDATEWFAKGKFLPPFLRDFHSQKDLFKTLDDYFVPSKPEYEINWVKAHVFTIDRFLWFMAQHGYTLQRNRSHIKFKDIYDTLEVHREHRMQQSAKEMVKYVFRNQP